MTTVAAMDGALPLMLGSVVGSELRHPLGLAIVPADSPSARC